MQFKSCKLAVVLLLLHTSFALADHRRHFHYHRHRHGPSALGVALKVLPYLASARRSYRYSSVRYYGPYGYRSYGSYCYGYPFYTRTYHYAVPLRPYFYQPYGVFYSAGSNRVDYNLPPVYQPAELAYGPQALKQFFGLDRDYATRPVLPASRLVDLSTTKREPVIAASVRGSSPAELARARRDVTNGDRLFRDGKYHEALQKYKSASRQATDLAEAHFRQGISLIATGRYELAATSVKKGIQLSPEFVVSGFRLDEIYGDAHLAKSTHVESLARAALERPDDSDMLFLLGMFLHLDGESDRAKKFFRRASELAGSADAHVRPWLKGAKPKTTADKEA